MTRTWIGVVALVACLGGRAAAAIYEPNNVTVKDRKSVV